MRALLERADLPVGLRLSAAQRAKLFAAMQLDKKVSAGVIKFVLAERLGKVAWGKKVPQAALNRALDSLNS